MARLWPFNRDGATSGPIVAAAQRLIIGDRKVRRPKPQEWQRKAWDFYDDVGEIKYAYRYVGNCLGRVRFYVGVLMDGDDPPMPIQDALALTGDDQVPGLTDELAITSVELLRRVRSPWGGAGAIQREMAVNLGVAGECYLVGREQPNEPSGELWDVLSVDELRYRGGTWEIVDGATAGAGEKLDPETSFVLRIWWPHPRRSKQPDSAMRGVLDRCEELMLLQLGNIAAAQSRLANAGLLYVDSTLNPIAPIDRTKSADDPAGDPFAEAFIDAGMAAITDPGEASAAFPIFVRGEGPLNDRIVWVRSDRTIGAEEMERQEALIRRIAQGIDVPLERILGLGDTSTYANALLVTRDEFTAHLQPYCDVESDAYTCGWLQPGLADVFPRMAPELLGRLVVWYDPTPILIEPDRKDDTKWLHEEGLIADAVARKEFGRGEDDAPTPEELAERAEQGRLGKRPAILAPGGLPAATGENATPALVAATTAHQPALDRLAQRMTEIDTGLGHRLTVEAGTAVDGALRLAGSRLRSQVQGRRELAQRLRGVAAVDVGTTVGVSVARALAVNDGDLLDGAFDDLGTRFDEWTDRAHRASIRAVQRAGAELTDGQVDDYQRRFEDNRRDGWRYLAAALAALTAARIYDPTVVEPTVGEFDPTLSVAPGLIRQTLAVTGGQTSGAVGPAGGAPVLEATGAPSGGIATGPNIGDLVRAALRAELVGWVWLHAALGEPATPFDSHEALDGVEFDSWTADVLANPGDWPPVDFLYPGDHDYCTCGFAPRLGGVD